MTYRWFIYFHGPKCWWSGKLDASEQIARGEAPFLWMARAQLRAACKALNPDRCAYLLERSDGQLIEQHAPPTPAMATV